MWCDSLFNGLLLAPTPGDVPDRKGQEHAHKHGVLLAAAMDREECIFNTDLDYEAREHKGPHLVRRQLTPTPRHAPAQSPSNHDRSPDARRCTISPRWAVVVFVCGLVAVSAIGYATLFVYFMTKELMHRAPSLDQTSAFVISCSYAICRCLGFLFNCILGPAFT